MTNGDDNSGKVLTEKRDAERSDRQRGYIQPKPPLIIIF